MAIWIVLTDDWELRGNGTGRVEDLQQKPALRLMDLYDGLGIKSTFNVEVMQQLAFENHADRSDAVRSGRDAWRETVRTMLARGFDVQLHLHPQWMDAELIDGWWKLGRRWHIADYGAAEIDRMIDGALRYVKPLVAPHTIKSFRAGSWGMGPPSRAALAALARHGIKIDVSVVNGNYYDGEAIRLDYRSLDSPFLPYRPDLDDVRRLPRRPESAAALIEIPTQSVSLAALGAHLLAKFGRTGNAELIKQVVVLVRDSYAVARVRRLVRGRPDDGRAAEVPAFVLQDPFGLFSGRGYSDVILDLSSKHSPVVWASLVDICVARASKSGRSTVVLIFENHTKDLQRAEDFDRIAMVITHIKVKYPELEFKTLSEVADRLDQVA